MAEEIINASTNNTVKAEAKKIPHIRSVSYPAYPIDSSVVLVTKIDKEFTSTVFTPKDAISKSLGMSGGNFLMQLSSAVQYGLLELKSGEGYKPTELFIKIKKPMPHESVQDALVECVNHPKLYKQLIAEFKEKQLPSEAGLANILDRLYGVKGSAAETAAKIFMKNLKSLGLLTDDSILKMGSYIAFVESTNSSGSNDNLENINEPVTQTVYLPVPEKINTPTPHPIGRRSIPVFLQGENREATLILPMDFSEDDLKRIIKVLNAYLP